MKHLVCLLEEQSAKEMLEGILPKLLPSDIGYLCIAFDGKQDLEAQLVRRLRGWLKPDTFFLIMRDQDSSDCKEVKKHLSDLCSEAGRPETLIRIACHELESFYFGDLSAVQDGLGISNIVEYQKKAKYRDPDSIINPSSELEKLTKGQYQHVMGSRSIAPYLSLDNNTSHSFNVLISGIKKLCSIP